MLFADRVDEPPEVDGILAPGDRLPGEAADRHVCLDERLHRGRRGGWTMRRWLGQGGCGRDGTPVRWVAVRVAHPPMASWIPDVTTVEEALEHDVIVRHNDA